MILNENVPCRASRAWWLPFTSLALGLFTVPVAAQEVQDPVRVEIRVNGKQVDELSAAERKALLRRLLEAEEKVDQAPEPRPAKKADKKPAKKPDPKPKKARVQVDVAADDVHDGQARHEAHGDMPSAKQMHEMMRAGLAEARAEIEGDADLRELGITDEVGRLIDDVAAGKGMGGSLDAVIKAAMKGAGRMVEKELAADEDLRAMGLTDGITRLVRGMLENERTQEMMGEFVQRTMERAMKDAKLEIRATPELQELGIAVDVEGLLDSVLSGKGDFDAKLQTLIEKAMAGAHKLHGGAHGHDEGAAAEPVAPKKKARKAKLELR